MSGARISFFPSLADQEGNPADALRRLKWFNDVEKFINGEGLTLPAVQTVGASPWTFKYLGSNGTDLIVNGGTVTQIALSRDLGVTFFPLGVTAGMFSISPGDWVKITYTVIPAVTLVQR